VGVDAERDGAGGVGTVAGALEGGNGPFGGLGGGGDGSGLDGRGGRDGGGGCESGEEGGCELHFGGVILERIGVGKNVLEGLRSGRVVMLLLKLLIV